MRNLVIGNTSQLANYFSDDFVKISSRNIDYDFLKSQNWNNVYLCFGESRKFIDDNSLYDEINFELTKKVIQNIFDFSSKIYVFSTCELWNKYSGPISLEYPFNFYLTPYLISKYKITKYILDDARLSQKVILIFPFNFNSIYRSENFLFGKIFKSIVEKKKIEIGNTHFYRDIIHPKFLIKETLNTTSHKIVGSGRMIYVNDFIQDLYKSFDLNYDEFVVEKKTYYSEYPKINEYYYKSQEVLYDYKFLLQDTIKEIKRFLNERSN